jgi:hypothetical protein
MGDLFSQDSFSVSVDAFIKGLPKHNKREKSRSLSLEELRCKIFNCAGVMMGGCMAKNKHIAVATQDPEKMAQFYKDVFGMREIARINSPGAICQSLRCN